jgi:hypothetical protein
VTPNQAGSSSQLPQPAGTTTDPQAAQIPYQPRGPYPYALGSWGYHYPQFPTSVSSSATAAEVAQGDSVANLMASGTFPYPYTPTQYAPGQPAYVPPIKYPYGAPAVSTPAPSSPSAGIKPTSSTTAQTQEQPYNGFLWKQPYTGPRDSTAPAVAAEPQSQSESTPSNDAPESTRKTDEVLTLATTNDDIVPPTEAPLTDNPAPASFTEGVTALKLHT